VKIFAKSIAAAAAAVLTLTALAGTQASGAPVEPLGLIRPAATATVPGSYLVMLRGGSAPQQLIRRYGGRLGHVYQHALRGFEVALPELAARRMAADPAVAYVQQNGFVSLDVTAAAGIQGTQPNPPSWGLDRIDQRLLPLDRSYTYPNTAPNVHAYILSTGIRFTHTDFGGRAVSGRDVIDNDNDASDCNGNGTYLAGIVGGAKHGVAKGVTLVGVRILNCTGSATFAQVIAGIDWVTANAVKPAVAVLAAGGGANTALDDAVRNSIASGVSYAVTAGSSGGDACSFSPGRVATAITAGATNSTDTRLPSSNYGPCLDLFAPGGSILSTWYASDTATITITGTTPAAAHTAGAAALIASRHPTWTAQQVRNKLVADATPGVVINPGPGSPNLLLYVDNSGA
jgi:subtilisin family serine protease